MSYIVGMKMPKLYVIRSGHSLGNDKKQQEIKGISLGGSFRQAY